MRLSKFYKDTTFTQMFVFPDTTYVDSLYFFRGREIDSITCNLLPDKVTRTMTWREGFYGNYSFKINDQYVGLISRTPGEYSPTTISLWIYDVKNDSITNDTKLADVYGDAGDYEVVYSYLFFDKEKKLNAFTYIYDSYDRSLDDENDKTFDKWHHYSLLRINYSSIDTITKDSILLCNQFKKQLEKIPYQ